MDTKQDKGQKKSPITKGLFQLRKQTLIERGRAGSKDMVTKVSTRSNTCACRIILSTGWYNVKIKTISYVEALTPPNIPRGFNKQ